MKKIIILIFIAITVGNLSSQTVWEQTNGPYSGEISRISKDKLGSILAITSNYYLYRSKDNGENWERLATNISAIAFDSENNYYLGNTSGVVSVYNSDMQLKNKSSISYIDYMYVEYLDFDSKENLYAKLLYGGLYISTNKGKSWKVFSDDKIFSQISMDSSNVIIMTDFSNGISRTTNNGADWTFIKINDASYRRGIYYTAFNKISNTFIAVGIGNIVYISNDLGLTWQQIKDSIPIYFVEAITIDEIGDTYIGGDNFVLRSTDGGNNWSKLDGFSSVRTISLTSKENEIFAGTWSNGIKSYNINSKEINDKSKGIVNSNINQLAISKQDYIYASTRGGLYQTQSNGYSWEQINLPDNSDFVYTSLLCSNSGNIYLSSENGVFVSKNEGQSWEIINNLDTIPEIQTCFAEADDGRIYAGNRLLYYSDDKGISWQSIDIDVNEIVSISTYQNKYVLVGTFSEGVYFSEDKCSTFRKLPIDVPENYGTIVNFNSKGNLFICMNAWFGGDAVFRSLDYGKTFTSLESLDNRTEFFKIDKNNNLYYCEGNIQTEGKNQILYSKDNGDNWHKLLDSSIGDIYIKDIIFGKNNEAFLGTQYDGVFRTNNLSKVDDDELLSGKFKIVISPNPAGEYITINFGSIGACSDDNGASPIASIEIYDVMGIKIQTAPFETKNFSSLQKIDVSNLATGVYFVKIGGSNGACSIVEKFVKM